MAEIFIDNYREYDITDTRRVRKFDRAVNDETSPILIELYYKDNALRSMDPLITNAVILDYEANIYIEAIKASRLASHFIVFLDDSDPNNVTKYITHVIKQKSLEESLKRIEENGLIVFEYDTVDNFKNNLDRPPIEYEELIVDIDIQANKDSILYIDEILPLKCIIDWSSGENDWFAYRYLWNISRDNSPEVFIMPENQSEISATCLVEFRLINEPTASGKAIKYNVNKKFSLVPVPDPRDMYVKVDVRAINQIEEFLIDHKYEFVMELSNLSGWYEDWELEKVDWNINKKENLYEAEFIPLEKDEGEFSVISTVTYRYKRDSRKKCSFEGRLTKNVVYPEIYGQFEILTDITGKIFIDDTVTFDINPIALYNDKYWDLVDYRWNNAIRNSISPDKAIARMNYTGNIEIQSYAIFSLKKDPLRKKELFTSKIIEVYEIMPMSCLINIDCDNDKVFVDNDLELRLDIRNEVNSNDWNLAMVLWQGATATEDQTVAILNKNNTGLYEIKVSAIFEDKYGRGKELVFEGTRNITVDYHNNPIGTVEILRNIETVYLGDNIDLSVDIILTDKPDSWQLVSGEWINANPLMINNRIAAVYDIREDVEVSYIAKYRSLIYNNVERSITGKLLLKVNPLPDIEGEFILTQNITPILVGENAILNLSVILDSKTDDSWRITKIDWNGAAETTIMTIANFGARTVAGQYLVTANIEFNSKRNNHIFQNIVKEFVINVVE